METFSYSRLNLFENCPMAYKFRYIDKVKVEKPQTIEQFAGEKVHESLQFLHSEIMSKKIPSLNYLLTRFDIDWRKSFEISRLIVNKYEDFHSKALQCVRSYYDRHYPFENDKTTSLEKKVFRHFDNFNLVGYIDRLEEAENKMIIHDYKTSTSKYLDPDQMKVYHLCINPEKDAEYVWHFVYLDDFERQNSGDLKNFENLIYFKVDKIDKEKEFARSKSLRCNWCEFKEMCLAAP